MLLEACCCLHTLKRFRRFVSVVRCRRLQHLHEEGSNRKHHSRHHRRRSLPTHNRSRLRCCSICFRSSPTFACVLGPRPFAGIGRRCRTRSMISAGSFCTFANGKLSLHRTTAFKPRVTKLRGSFGFEAAFHLTTTGGRAVVRSGSIYPLTKASIRRFSCVTRMQL